MTISYHNFYVLFGAATKEQDRERYIAEWSASSIFYPDENSPDIDADEPADALGNIWDVAHLTVRDIRQHLGLTQAAFAERFCIPRRTVENWERKGGHIPQYNILAYADIAGMLKVHRT